MNFNLFKKKLYFNEEIILDGSELCETLLQKQGIDEKTAKLLLTDHCVTRLVFSGDKLVSKDEGDWGGEWNYKTQTEEEASFLYRDTPTHPVHIIDYVGSGFHQVGGSPPVGFQFPTHQDLPVSCQYIGKIFSKDPVFSWLPIPELHLTYPLFAAVGPLFMDYSEALSPTILPFKFYDHTFKSVTKDSIIEFEKLDWAVQGLQTNPVYDNQGLKSGFGWAGVPFWIQHPEWPRCPKTGHR